MKIKVALKIQMSLRKLSGKVSAAAAAAAGGDGGVPYMLCVCVYVCVLMRVIFFLSIIKWRIPRHLRAERV